MQATFAQLGVPNDICLALERRGINTPFEIQAATIADALEGRDVCGRAPTGSGKTLAFGVPLVVTVGVADPRRPRALVLAPTRELADQIAVELRSFAGDVRVGVVYGGVGYGKQFSMLRRGVDILVACPGRLEDLLDQDGLTLADVDQVVIDEADRMADMGFLPAVRRLLDQTSPQRQTVLFSATLDGDVAQLTRSYQRNPVRHEVGEAKPDITLADHQFWRVERADRIDATVRAITENGQAIVFCRTRHGSDRLARQLGQRGVDAVAIHGGHAQNKRRRSLAQFTAGKTQALVATDVAARGIHVDEVDAVVHYDPPEDHKTYIHRSGRTARAGRGGVVVSLVQPDQARDTHRMKVKLGLAAADTESNSRSSSTRRDRSQPSGAKAKSAGTKSKSSGAKAKSSGGQRKSSAGRARNGRPKSKNGSHGNQRSHNGNRPKGKGRSRPKSRSRNRNNSRRPAARR